jgi:hypothetical protein
VGGSWGGPIDDTVLPQQYLIDYVRVFKASGGQADTSADTSKLRH